MKAFVAACGLGFAVFATPLSAQQFVCSGAHHNLIQP